MTAVFCDNKPKNNIFVYRFEALLHTSVGKTKKEVKNELSQSK